MSLRHAILTALLEKPSSGLELTRRFDRSIGYFWSATHQQIYRELGRLEEAGYVRALPSDTPTRGQRKEYEVLPAGRAELTAWVAETEDPKPVRDPLLLRVRASGVVGPQGLEAELRRHLGLQLARCGWAAAAIAAGEAPRVLPERDGIVLKNRFRAAIGLKA